MLTEFDVMPYQTTAVPNVRRVIVFAPHADDEVFGCGGATALHAAAGADVHIVIVTDGAARTEASAQRLAESAAAAAVLGIARSPVCWGLPDRGVQIDENLIVRMASLIDDLHADLVYAPWPGEVHPDHQTVAGALLCATAKLKVSHPQLALYEVGMPLRPTHLLDITPVQTLKQQAMQCFTSQMVYQSYDEHISGLNRFRTYTLAKEVKAAEAFIMTDAKTVAAGFWPVLQAPHLVDAQALFHRFFPSPEEVVRRTELDALKLELHALRSSKSWRYTQPLRRLLSWIRRAA